MDRWKAGLMPSSRWVQILVTDPLNNETLKAELPPRPRHPRALLTVLEGVAMWVGEPLTVATCAGRQLSLHYDEGVFGEPLFPADSALVRFEFVPPPARRRTLAGVGDFSQLRAGLRRAR